MVKPSRGTLSGKTRTLKGKGRHKVSVAQEVRTFSVGNKVVIIPMAHPKGQPNIKRFSHTHGEIVGKQGRSYLVKVMDNNKQKIVVAGPIHLKLAA